MHRRSAASLITAVASPALVALGLALTLLAGAACSDQGEGDRCDKNGSNSGNDECSSGLICTARGELSSSPLTDICCPSDRTRASTQVCGQVLIPFFEAGLPEAAADASDASDDAAFDATSDATGDGSDAATDAAAPLDAAGDTGDAAAPLDAGPG